MAELTGFTATITGLSMSMPNACCRCGAPPTKTLPWAQRSRSFGVGSSCVPGHGLGTLVGTVSRPGGRGVARPRRGRSGLRRTGCWCEPGRGDLSVQGNREQTADGPGNRAQARVKRCGKSAPALGATPAARQPPPGARSNVGGPVRPISPGRPHRWMATPEARAEGQNPAYKPAHRHHRL